MNVYDRYVLPGLLTAACGVGPIRHQRRKLVPLAKGRVLELGMGPGLNLPFYDPAKVERVIGVDPSYELRKKALKQAEETALSVDYLVATADDMPVENASIDTLVLTYTLCSIPDAVAALNACRRVLRPDAKILFCEHGVAPDPQVARWQRRLNPLWRTIAGGCQLDRNIPELILAAGYRIERCETMYLPSSPRFAGFNYWGEASLS